MKTLKIALMTISVSVLCASCGTNQLESAANNMEKAVKKADKAAIVDAMKAFELEKAKNDVIEFPSIGNDFIGVDEQREINEFVAAEMTKKFSSLVDDYESCVDDYVELLAEINKGKTDKIDKILEVQEKMDQVLASQAAVQKYFNEELQQRIEKANALLEYVATDVFKAALYQILLATDRDYKKAESASYDDVYKDAVRHANDVYEAAVQINQAIDRDYKKAESAFDDYYDEEDYDETEW
ncbi:MAG: hypothetical protein SO182_01875 [Paludibacteraceae bacterium]|nr:hypothetical protein [Paludibacteraceae bacterium]